MYQRFSIKKLVFELAFFYSPWVILGLIFGHLPWLLLMASWIQGGWHFYNQRKLSLWLSRQKRLRPPSSSGNWELLFNDLYRRQQVDRRRRKELLSFLRQFRNGGEALPDAVVVFRNEGHIVWCNKLAQSLLGLRWPDDVGQPISNLLRSPDFVRYWRKKEFDHPLEICSPFNYDRFLELRITSYSDGEYLMVVRDVSQLKQLEGMRRNFFANVSHELRTPMTVLQGYLEMSEDPEMLSGPMWSKAHGVMTEQLSRMNALVAQLLTLSKIEAAPILTLDEIVDVPAMLDILEKEAASLSEEKNHVLNFDVDHSLMVFADKEQLRSAVSNLVYNAVKHTPEGAEVCVKWFLSPDGPRLEVKDKGQGIEAQHLHRLTERFYRVDKARSRETGGSGLGLAIVKHALSHHDSHLEIESTVGHGSLFAFTLPNRLVSKAA